MPAGAVTVKLRVADANATVPRSARPGAEPACSCQPVIVELPAPPVQVNVTVNCATVAVKFAGAAGGGTPTNTSTSLDAAPGFPPYKARTRTK